MQGWGAAEWYKGWEMNRHGHRPGIPCVSARQRTDALTAPSKALFAWNESTLAGAKLIAAAKALSAPCHPAPVAPHPWA